MQYIDIASLLRDALVLSGCTDEQIGSFDGHSTIELELSDLPAINIGIVDDGVWFWSGVIESSDRLLDHCASDLLRFLMKGFVFARTEQLQLVDSNGILEVRALLAESAIASPETLAEALDSYLNALTSLNELLRR